MAKPVLLVVDDDLGVLNAVERDLRRRYAREYRLVKAASGELALDAVRQLKRRAVPVALFLVDQRMPAMTGTEFLEQAIPYYPEARKVLLTAYADTQAAITSINALSLDYYLMKPWDPPEERLYPVLDDLLSDWRAKVIPLYEGIRVAGTLWSATSHTVKDFLARNQIPYQWLDIEKDDQARLLVEEAAPGDRRLPVVFFEDGSSLVQPSLRELAEKTGIHTQAAQPFYDLVIIGAGPAGLAAAVYGASEGLRTVMIEKEAPGGQAGTSSRIENYLGFPAGLSGADLSRRAVAQAQRFGVEILTSEAAVGLRVEDSYRFVRLESGAELSCHALILASGVAVRRLDVPGMETLTGAGVYYGAALTEAAYYRGQDVFVLGGGNSAGQAAVFLSRYARSVSILIRGARLEPSMSQYLIEQIHSLNNVQVLGNVDVVEVRGDTRLEAICLSDRLSGEVRPVPAAALFLFIGAEPRTGMVGDLVECDPAGFVLTGPELLRSGRRPKGWMLSRDPYLLETSCPGIFAAGDVRHGSVKRVGSAVGEGSVVIALVHQYLKTV